MLRPLKATFAALTLAAGLLVLLTAWWVAHDGPEENGGRPVKPTTSARPALPAPKQPAQPAQPAQD